MEITYIEIIGYFGASLTTFSFLPQTIQTVKTKDTSSISLIMYLTFTIGVAFWLIFGFLSKNYIIVFANILTLIFSSIILFIKIKNLRNGIDKY